MVLMDLSWFVGYIKVSVAFFQSNLDLLVIDYLLQHYFDLDWIFSGHVITFPFRQWKSFLIYYYNNLTSFTIEIFAFSINCVGKCCAEVKYSLTFFILQ